MKPLLFKTKSAVATRKLAALFAEKISRSHLKSKNAFVAALTGELGSGKTTFIQGFARGLGIKRRLTSPTFLIIRNYKLKTKNYKLLYHVDCYRLKKPKELTALGFKEIIENRNNMILIEWAEKIKRISPKGTIWLKFDHGQKENERIIKINESST